GRARLADQVDDVPDDVGVVRAGKTAIARDHHDADRADLVAGLQQRELRRDLTDAGQLADRLLDPARVRTSLDQPVLRLDDPRRGNELHRPRDLGDRADRLDLLLDLTEPAGH